MRYTSQQLRNAYLRDLISDIRCADRDRMPEYRDKCKAELAKLWSKRHSARINRYGIPK
jgi:hypothetical protein